MRLVDLYSSENRNSLEHGWNPDFSKQEQLHNLDISSGSAISSAASTEEGYFKPKINTTLLNQDLRKAFKIHKLKHGTFVILLYLSEIKKFVNWTDRRCLGYANTRFGCYKKTVAIKVFDSKILLPGGKSSNLDGVKFVWLHADWRLAVSWQDFSNFRHLTSGMFGMLPVINHGSLYDWCSWRQLWARYASHITDELGRKGNCWIDSGICETMWIWESWAQLM